MKIGVPIGVITTQYSPNFGALLQTFTLKKFLRTLESVDDSEVIDYFPRAYKLFLECLFGEKGYWK